MIRTVVAVTLNYDHPQRGQIQALKALVPNVVEFDYLEQQRQGVRNINNRLIDICDDVNPDWIWMQLQDTDVILSDVIGSIRTRHPNCVVTHWTGDLRPEVSRYLSSICKACHITYISSCGQIGMFFNAGASDVKYLQIGLDWDEDVLGMEHEDALALPEHLRGIGRDVFWEPPFRVPDVVFCGGYYGDRFPGTATRIAAIRALRDSGIDVGVVGGGWPDDIRTVGTCTVKQQHHVYRRAKVALSINHFNDVDRYYSDRLLIAMASGTPVVAYKSTGIELEFFGRDGLGPELLLYSSEEELIRVVRLLLSDDMMRRSVGRNGRAIVIRDHTWLRMMLQVIPDVERVHERLVNR